MRALFRKNTTIIRKLPFMHIYTTYKIMSAVANKFPRAHTSVGGNGRIEHSGIDRYMAYVRCVSMF